MDSVRVASFLDSFRRLNRKERYYVGNLLFCPSNEEQALKFHGSVIDIDLQGRSGIARPNPRLLAEIKSRCGIPPLATLEAYALDYHLDWIDAALQLAKGEAVIHIPEVPGATKGKRNSTPLDSDVVMVFLYEGNLHLIFIEIKVFGYWDSTQLAKKVARLELIFGPKGNREDGFIPHMFLIDLLNPGGRPDKMPIPKGRTWPQWSGADPYFPPRLHFHQRNFVQALRLQKIKGKDQHEMV